MSASRNEERLGHAHVSNDSQIPAQENNQEKLLDFVVPTEFVELPSQGKFYSKDSNLHNKDVIEIRYVTAADEDVLTSRALLKKGIAIDRFLQGLVVDKSIKLDDLLIGDKNAIVLAARISGYGSNYKTKISCQSCEKTFEYEFDLEESLNINNGNFEDNDAIYNPENNTFSITLPKTKVILECRFLTGNDEKTLEFMNKKKKKHGLQEIGFTDQYMLYIVSANSVTDKNMISRFVKAMPSIDSKFLRDSYRKITPNIELREGVICEVCESEYLIDIPFNTDFFWPK